MAPVTASELSWESNVDPEAQRGPHEAGASSAQVGPTTAPGWAAWHAVPLAWRRPLAVLVGGCIGTGLRIGVGALVGTNGGWPVATLVANLTGALLLGYVLTRLQQAAATTVIALPLLATGVLGSYTTFSALTVETWQLWADGHPAVAAGYVAASLVGGLLLATAGIGLAERRP